MWVTSDAKVLFQSADEGGCPGAEFTGRRCLRKHTKPLKGLRLPP
jgi:hypothetical protein